MINSLCPISSLFNSVTVFLIFFFFLNLNCYLSLIDSLSNSYRFSLRKCVNYKIWNRHFSLFFGFDMIGFGFGFLENDLDLTHFLNDLIWNSLNFLDLDLIWVWNNFYFAWFDQILNNRQIQYTGSKYITIFMYFFLIFKSFYLFRSRLKDFLGLIANRILKWSW
jgi:hypothetical protein